MTHLHKRFFYLALVLFNIPDGISTRRYGAYLPHLVAVYGGDVLAASCIFFGVRFLWIRKPLWRVALWAYLVCIIIETAQLYRAPWIVQFRVIPAVEIFLGQGFLWSDWICYAVGVVIGLGIAIIGDNYQLSPKKIKN